MIAGRVAGGSLLAIIRRTPRSTITDRAALKRLFSVNRDIMIRSFCLLGAFMLFARLGAQFGTLVLAANGIKTRHYALDRDQNPTHNVYEMATLAIQNMLIGGPVDLPISYLSAGSTCTPFSGPGMGSIVHGMLADGTRASANYPLEVNSNAGICTSAAMGLVNACRAIQVGDHAAAICVGAEEPSRVLKSNVIDPPQDSLMIEQDIKRSQWFMSVFLRFMLSDGAGACLLQNQPAESGTSLKIDWTFSQSFANEAPLCMKMENRSERLTQDVKILSRYLFKCAEKLLATAFERHGDSFDGYRVILPHISSFFFRRKMERVIRKFTIDPDLSVDYWTNLSSVGNVGSASIFLMLDEFLKTHSLRSGERILLFVPESGQFNFVLVSLTAVSADAKVSR